MITVGVDLAASPERTAAVRVDWTTSPATVTDVIFPASDDAIVAICADADRIGIDCPLGWPDAFVDLVLAHRDGAPVPPAATIAQREPLAYRATDLYCRSRYGLRPLSVSADRIGHAALRAASLAPRLDDNADRSGAGRLVEAYPAGALKMWGLPHRGYKRDPAQLDRSLTTLEQQVGLSFASNSDRGLCASVDHPFDAVVTALIARAVALGRYAVPPPEFAAVARREGWIAVPDPDLEALRPR